MAYHGHLELSVGVPQLQKLWGLGCKLSRIRSVHTHHHNRRRHTTDNTRRYYMQLIGHTQDAACLTEHGIDRQCGPRRFEQQAALSAQSRHERGVGGVDGVTEASGAGGERNHHGLDRPTQSVQCWTRSHDTHQHSKVTHTTHIHKHTANRYADTSRSHAEHTRTVGLLHRTWSTVFGSLQPPASA